MFNLYKCQLKVKCQELYDENIKLKKLLNEKNGFHDETEDPVHKNPPKNITLDISDISEISKIIDTNKL